MNSFRLCKGTGYFSSFLFSQVSAAGNKPPPEQRIDFSAEFLNWHCSALVPVRGKGISEHFCSLCSCPAQNRGKATGEGGALESNAKDFREYTSHSVLTAEVLPPLWDSEPGEDVLWQMLGQLILQAPSRWFYQYEWTVFASRKGIEFNSVQLWHVASKFFDSVSELTKYSTDEAQARDR